MTNLQAALAGDFEGFRDHFWPENSIRFLDDVQGLRKDIPELGLCTDGEVQFLYSEWSENSYCASWLIRSNETDAEFRDWLFREQDN